MDGLIRDGAVTRGHLVKVNEVFGDVASLEEKLKKRPTYEEVDNRLTKLDKYTPLAQFVVLKKLVSEKAEQMTQDELRVQVNALVHRANKYDAKFVEITS